MARKPRIQFCGAVYHVMSRGDRREEIFDDDVDRAAFLRITEQAAGRFGLNVLAYCLMGNHYHFILQTREANLANAMRHLNGVYTQLYNRRHGTCGHVFQGRYTAHLIGRDAYLQEACRYADSIRCERCW